MALNGLQKITNKVINYKVIDFAPELMTNSRCQPIWNNFLDRLNLRLSVNSAKYIAR